MGRLAKKLREVRREMEALVGGGGPPGPGNVDLEPLNDTELERFERLLSRVVLTSVGRTAAREPPPHRPGADEGRTGWSCGCELCRLPEGGSVRPPTPHEEEMLRRLLAKARVGRP